MRGMSKPMLPIRRLDGTTRSAMYTIANGLAAVATLLAAIAAMREYLEARDRHRGRAHP